MIRVIRHHAPAGAFPLLISEILLICGAFYVAAMLFEPDPLIYFLYQGGMERALLVLASLLGALYVFDLYSDIEVRSRVMLLQQLCQAVGVAMIAQSLIAYAFRDYILPHFLMLYGSVFTLMALLLWRMLYSAVLLHAVGRERILFVGCNATVQEVTREIASDPSTGYEVAGYVADSSTMSPAMANAPVLGTLASLRKVVAENKPRRIVVGLPERREHMPVQDLLELRFGGCRIEEAGVTYETVFRRICSRDLSPARVPFLPEFAPPVNSLWLSRIVGRMLAVLLIVVLSPLLLGIYLALRIGSRSPALVTVPRLGRDARIFNMLRFRHSSALGSVYHRLGLAALPALLNVIRGEMAVVGPRPASPEDSEVLSAKLPLFDYRHNVLPGMTGWAQINSSGGRQLESVDELEYDLYYIKHMSQALDGYILLNTFKNRVLRVQS
ncbi:MAG: sugar transferase [Bryobacterales bacterium]|nr:sugar transferase [Bryobacterales bacterium]